MKIAIAQLNYTIGDVDGNASKIIDSIHKAKAQHADLVIFAEQAVSGTPAFDLLRKTTFLELCEDALVEIASCCDGIAAIVGLPILTADGTISAAALIQDRKVLRYIGKKYITARREMGFLVPSKGYEYATIKGHKCAIIVGDDLSRERDFDQSVETVISINARKYGKGTMTYRYEMMRNLAFVESKNLVLVNQVGGSTDIVYDGTSGALNSRGELVLMMKNFEEDFQIFDTKASARPITIPSTYNDRTRLVYEAARCGLRDFFRKNGYRKASIGLSGGIDSAVVASIAADALGAENVRALLMPSPFSSLESVEDAKELARNLGIEYNVIPISEIYTSVVNTLKPVIGGTEFDATEENIQTRIRTVLLMALQNKTDYILLNSSNKSENALGLCTLYGDTAGAFSPTGDLYKSEMYDVARYINRTQGNPIPESILTKEPSSELHPGQKDSDILPPYEVVDAILFRMIEEGQHREEIVNAGFDSEVVEKIHGMIMRNEKKRYQFPPVLRLSSCTFGHERLMPLTNNYGDEGVADLIEHCGVVERTERDTVYVRITSRSACGTCKARQACGLAEAQDKIVAVATPEAGQYAAGREVMVGVRRSAGVRAVVLAYVGALAVLLAVLVGTIAVAGWSEGAGALAAIAGVGVYYFALWLFRRKIEHTIQFTITKI